MTYITITHKCRVISKCELQDTFRAKVNHVTGEINNIIHWIRSNMQLLHFNTVVFSTCKDAH